VMAELGVRSDELEPVAKKLYFAWRGTQPAAPAAMLWWCATNSGGMPVGTCARDKPTCEESRGFAIAAGVFVNECRPAASAVCFSFKFVENGMRAQSCGATHRDCNSTRDVYNLQTERVVIEGPCLSVQ
jgi:hypothetical protein